MNGNDRELLRYILKELQRQTPIEKIKADLVDVGGWSDSEFQNVLLKANKVHQKPVLLRKTIYFLLLKIPYLVLHKYPPYLFIIGMLLFQFVIVPISYIGYTCPTGYFNLCINGTAGVYIIFIFFVIVAFPLWAVLTFIYKKLGMSVSNWYLWLARLVLLLTIIGLIVGAYNIITN